MAIFQQLSSRLWHKEHIRSDAHWHPAPKKSEAVKMTQEIRCHASSRLTLELDVQGTMPEKRMAQSRVTRAVGTALVPRDNMLKS